MKLRQSGMDIAFDIVNYGALTMILMAVLYPLVYIVSASFSDANMVASGIMWLFPVKPTLEGYRRILATPAIWIGYRNTILYTSVGTLLSVCLTILGAFTLSRKDFPGRNIFMGLFVFTMFFHGGLIPTYLVVKQVGILNTMWAMILPRAVGIWEIIIMRTYIQTTIPKELQDAADMDGCPKFRYLVSIVLPLSLPILAVVTLFYGVNYWNAFFEGLIYLNKEKLYPLQIILRNILLQSVLSEQMTDAFSSSYDQRQLSDIIKYGVIIVSSLPMLMLYPFLQRYFIKGLLVGSLKG